ncbi:MAG: GNAT family N-acetyltransferase [Gammaproteobacteria bacterium]|jgi:predicted GNAT family N-acyltransferase|nr:MAG: hypothetical protein AMJ59_14995 [Gammaproteobacteria bacterium SG8_31]
MTAVFSIRRADWDKDRDVIRRVRQAVFVVEQSVPADLEWDGQDEACLHVLAESSNRDVIGTGRLQPSGKIGRMAVLRPWRGIGVGSAILRALIVAASELGIDEVYLHAQNRAVPFYDRFGFEAEGDEFMEAGIPHRLMRRRARMDR